MRKLLPLTLALAGTAQAIGLGSPSETPTLGKPLRLEIPLTGHTGAAPAIECFQLAPIPGTADELYFPRQARIQVETRQGKPVAVVTAGNTLQPVVEFRLTIGCTYGLARDYTFLTALPLLENPKPAVEAPVVTRPVIAAPTPTSAETLRLTREATLESLARERYPAQPKAREKFKHMMQSANSARIPGGEGFDSLPLPAGTELAIPRGLPERRQGPYVPPQPAPSSRKPANKPSPASETATTQKPAVPATAGKTSANKDRLVLDASAAPPLSAAEAEAELTRLETIHADQVKAQEALDERIARAQEAFADIKEHLLRTEARLRALEEQNQELARRNADTQTWQLAIAVLLGGVLGAGLLRVYPLMARRRKPAEDIAILLPAATAAVKPMAPREAPASTAQTIPAEFPALRAYGLKTEAAKTETAPATSPAMAPESPIESIEAKPVPPTLEPLDFDFTPASGRQAGGPKP